MCRLLLEGRSLHIFELDAYEKYLHSMEDFKIDSVIIQVEADQHDKKTKITRASVDNFHLTRLSRLVLEAIKDRTDL